MPALSAPDCSLLLELPVPFRQTPTGLFVEAQALNGLRCWSDNFERMTICAPIVPERLVTVDSMTWLDPSQLLAERNITLQALPWAYHPLQFLRSMRGVAALFERLIPCHRYLCFSGIGGIGSWGNIASAIAAKRRRPYALWFDWVVHEMPVSKPTSVKQIVKQSFDRWYCRTQTFRAIRNCSIGLFHGKTVFDAYSAHAKVSALVHDIHVGPGDAISKEELDRKLVSSRTRTGLRIGYVGRLHPMKAPLDWVDAVLRTASELGPGQVKASWLGDGPLRQEALERVAHAQAEELIEYPGFLDDRSALLRFLRELDVFVFCHVTPESPRCLIEALISGTPLVGYDSAYAQDLVVDHEAAVLVPVHDVAALSDRLVALARDREALCRLIEGAAASGARFNDAAVFEHRSALIKANLP